MYVKNIRKKKKQQSREEHPVAEINEITINEHDPADSAADRVPSVPLCVDHEYRRIKRRYSFISAALVIMTGLNLFLMAFLLYHTARPDLPRTIGAETQGTDDAMTLALDALALDIEKLKQQPAQATAVSDGLIRELRDENKKLKSMIDEINDSKTKLTYRLNLLYKRVGALDGEAHN